MNNLCFRGFENCSKKKRFIEKKYYFSQIFRMFENFEVDIFTPSLKPALRQSTNHDDHDYDEAPMISYFTACLMKLFQVFL